ncbi:hypothetical protein [Conexibacter woesei]|uniref:hypothetical protein n=1 Tax=Conexibacter woesei TaxID=191495 RepID=UPI0004148620|nr:hypothetical protein [Conexibacter woesei]
MGRPVRRTAAAVLAAASTLAAAGAALPAATTAAPTQSQTVFTQKLLDDPATSAGIKRMLKSKQAIVSPGSGFVDVTGDRRQDAVILVSTGGASGVVGLYVFSTHGQTSADQTSLRVIFRLQTLDDASLRLNGTTLSILEPRWSKGDDLCCPARLRERDYAFDAKALTFRRTADHTTPFTTS